MGRATIEAILKMSAEQVVGPRQQGKASERPLDWHGTQAGRVALAERQLRVDKPRLRKRKPADGEQAEVEIPAYEALRKNGDLADRMLGMGYQQLWMLKAALDVTLEEEPFASQRKSG